MPLIDSLNELRSERQHGKSTTSDDNYNLGWELTEWTKNMYANNCSDS